MGKGGDGTVKEICRTGRHLLTRARCRLSMRGPDRLVGRWDRARLEQVAGRPHRWAMSWLPNSEQETSLAPSIRRAKS
jgi:hypothetical protein